MNFQVTLWYFLRALATRTTFMETRSKIYLWSFNCEPCVNIRAVYNVCTKDFRSCTTRLWMNVLASLAFPITTRCENRRKKRNVLPSNTIATLLYPIPNILPHWHVFSIPVFLNLFLLKYAYEARTYERTKVWKSLVNASLARLKENSERNAMKYDVRMFFNVYRNKAFTIHVQVKLLF